jgi:hypothetical protein
LKKSRDLHQAFERLVAKFSEFEHENIVNGMERIEVEGIIKQVNRLHDKLEKFMNIVEQKFSG